MTSRYGAEPSLATRIEELDKLLARTPEEAWSDDCLASLAVAKRALAETSRDFGAYDAVWRALHQIRHKLCLHADWLELDVIASEVLVDLAYVTDAKERDDYRKKAHELIERLCHEEAKEPEPATRRAELHHLSIVAAGYRESRWRKANRTRARLARTNRNLILVLGACTLLLPIAMGHAPWTQPASWAATLLRLLTIIAFGALGGLLSGLMSRETLSSSSIEVHLEATALWLRPTVGATAAVILHLLLLTGVLSIGAAQGGSAGVSAVELLVAFVGGFSERFFVAQIDRLASKVTPPAKPA